MREGYVFNGNIIHSNLSIDDNLKKSYGINKFYKYKIEQRLERNLCVNIKDLSPLFWSIFIDCIKNSAPKKSNIKRRQILNIFVLDLITSYRGWRHYKGLPVRGQRTWSNHMSSFKSNLLLRNFKIKFARKFYGNLPVHEVSMALSAEQINLMWKLQWFNEWLSAKVGRLNYKGGPNTIKIDLFGMANNQIMNPMKFKKMTKKQRQSFKKNYFSLGFDPGFTKPLLKELYNSRMDSDFKSDVGSKLVFRKIDSKKTYC